MEDKKIAVTVEELKAAVANYELVLPTEVDETLKVFLAVPAFGQLVAGALQAAINLAGHSRAKHSQVLNAPVMVAFLMGVLVGREQGKKELAESGGHA